MANSIASVQEYLNSIIEQTYRMASLTTFLDTQGVEVNAFANAKLLMFQNSFLRASLIIIGPLATHQVMLLLLMCLILSQRIEARNSCSML